MQKVIGAVDLDRGQLAAGVFQLARLRMLGGIEHAAPRLIGPAADPDADVSRLRHASPHGLLPGKRRLHRLRLLGRPDGRTEDHRVRHGHVWERDYAHGFCADATAGGLPGAGLHNVPRARARSGSRFG